MNREAEIERCAREYLMQVQMYGKAEAGGEEYRLQKALELPKQEPVAYVPMTDEERNALIGKWQDDEDWIHSKQNLSQAVEYEVVRRMKEQRLL